MVKRLDLIAGTRKLILEYDNTFLWSKVYFSIFNFEFEIGESGFESFKKNMTSYLQQKHINYTDDALIKGKRSVVIETFHDSDSILYGTILEKKRIIMFCKLAGLTFYLRLKLTPRKIIKWLQRLDNLEKYSHNRRKSLYDYKTLMLETGEIKLVVNVNTGLSWCEIYIYDKKIFDLGQASLGDFKKRFILYLKQENAFNYENRDFNGYNIMWFFNIEVKHYSLFGTMHEKDCLRIFLMDEHGHILPNPILELSPETAEIWIHQLENFDLQSPN
jgi:hypothetical protein